MNQTDFYRKKRTAQIILCTVLCLLTTNSNAGGSKPTYADIPDSCSNECDWAGVSKHFPVVNKTARAPMEKDSLYKKTACISKHTS
jgi:hypothetical protein